MLNIKTLLVTAPLSDEYLAKLRKRLPDAELLFNEDGDFTEAELSRAQVVFGNLRPSLPAAMPELRWVQLQTAGSDAYASAVPESVLLTNSTGAYGPAIAEHMLGMLLALQRKFHIYRDAMETGEWLEALPVQSVSGSRVLIVGLGDLGGCFARLVKALGAYVIGLRRADAKKPDFADELHLMGELDSLLPEADVVALCLPNTPDTTRLMDARRLSLMKPGSVLINVGRGSAVDTDALCEALKNGVLGGAGLDVTSPEPLPPEHPLWRETNALITPHSSGGWTDPRTLGRVIDIFLDNLDRMAAKQPPRNVVDRVTGYMSRDARCEFPTA